MNKKFRLSLGVLALSATLLVACNKEDTKEEPVENKAKVEQNVESKNEDKAADEVALADWDGEWNNIANYLDDPGLKGAYEEVAKRDNITEEEAIAKARAFGGLNGLDLAKECCDPTGFEWSEGSWVLGKGFTQPELKYHVVAYDYGVKTNILRMLADRGCKLTVVPAETPAEKVLALNPDGVFLSNGPGDPAACDYAIEAVKTIVETTTLPVFGICLGHQILALASGAKTVKMNHGHHGANHPVQNLEDGTV
ncbi:MAG: hypothetical protein E6076_04840, partial [Peptoniphilus harei]|nr:hypothetical protein [Peptoniphilus harei]